MKTNKSFAKRIKVTKNGKTLVRKPGKNHFNAKASRSRILDKRGFAACHISAKTVAQNMPHASIKTTRDNEVTE